MGTGEHAGWTGRAHGSASGRAQIVLLVVALAVAVVGGSFVVAGLPGGAGSPAGVVVESQPAPPTDDPRIEPIRPARTAADRAPGIPRWTVVPSAIRPFGSAGEGLGDVTVHRPVAGREGKPRGQLPVVLLLGRRGVHPEQYGQLAHDLAAFGALVLVPDRATGPRAVAAAHRWAQRSPRADADGLLVLALDRPSARAAAAAPEVSGLAAHLTDDEPSLPSIGGLPAYVLSAEPRRQPGRHVVLAHDPDADPLAFTDEGRRGAPRGLSATGEQVERIAAQSRRLGTWFAAQAGDLPSRRFVEQAVADADAVVVGTLPW
jgi:hypothetical protein